jgi:hypothetical protein
MAVRTGTIIKATANQVPIRMRARTGKLLVLKIPPKPCRHTARSALDTAANLPVLSAPASSAL